MGQGGYDEPMTSVYTYTEARQKLASLLDQVAVEGEVRIKRRAGQTFVIRLEPGQDSPLAVAGIDLNLSQSEILEFIQQGRRFL